MHVVTNAAAKGLVATLLLSLPAAAQETGAPSDTAQPGTDLFRDEARVVAVDAMITANRSRTGTWLRGEAVPKRIDPKALTVRVGKTTARVVAVEGRAEPGDSEPWRIVVWLDRALSDGPSLRWATDRLANAAEALVELGTVEVLEADDEVRRIMPPTRETMTLDAALSRYAVDRPGGQDRLRRLREEFVTLAEDEPTDAAALAALAADLEGKIIEARHDLLLEALLDRDSGTARKALFWVTDGWDAEPARFYASTEMSLPATTTGDGEASDALGRALAAHGWIVFPFVKPPPPPPPKGFYVGKWFFFRPEIVPSDSASRLYLPIIAAVRKKYLDPDRARNFHTLGLTLRQQGKLDEAAQAFEKAIFHFQDDPRTVDEQAAAWAELATTLRTAERPRDAERAYRRAAELDAAVAQGRLPARLLDPVSPLVALADATSGRLLLDSNGLDDAIDDLGTRLRLTFELTGAPAGALLPLAIDHRRGLAMSAPGWARSATPPEIAAHRARRLLAEALEPSDLGASLDLDVRIAPVDGGEVTVEIAAAALGRSETSRYLRPTLALRTDEGLAAPTRVVHGPVLRLGPERTSWAWSTTLDALGPPGDSALLALIVDELDSGAWGAAVTPLVTRHD